MSDLTVTFKLKSALKVLDFLEDNTDECYTSDIPYPPSEEYEDFKLSLKLAVDKLAKGE